MKSIQPLSTIDYKDTERVIEEGQLKMLENHYQLVLYRNELVSSENTFHLENVWDVSYKTFSGGDNLLYLHTHRGVITYRVLGDPSYFVLAFKKIKNVNY